MFERVSNQLRIIRHRLLASASPSSTELVQGLRRVAIILRPDRNENARMALPDVERQGTAPPTPLFRSEAMVERQTQWLGPVLTEPRITHWMYVSFALLVAVTVLSGLIFGTYTRKAHISGWLVPQQGMMRVFAPHAGVATRIYVREGSIVKAGAPLVAVSGEERSASIGATRQKVVDQLLRRRESMSQESQIQQRLFEQQANDLGQRLAALQNEQRNLAEQEEIQRSRIALSNKAVGRTQGLLKRGFITVTRVEDAMRQHYEEVARLEDLKRNRSGLEREALQLRAQLLEIPLRRSTQIAEIDRNVATLGQEVAEAEARREIVITAPQDGVVASIQADVGGSVPSDVPMMTIVPKGRHLQAQLFAPSRAIGFLRNGQSARLRYAAFPYQKFGFHDGVVVSVSRSAISPSEMPQQLAGQSALFGATEPVYRVTVSLDKQAVTASGGSLPLQPGMLLDADIRLETRRLIEWVFEPILSLRSTWSR